MPRISDPDDLDLDDTFFASLERMMIKKQMYILKQHWKSIQNLMYRCLYFQKQKQHQDRYAAKFSYTLKSKKYETSFQKKMKTLWQLEGLLVTSLEYRLVHFYSELLYTKYDQVQKFNPVIPNARHWYITDIDRLRLHIQDILLACGKGKIQVIEDIPNSKWVGKGHLRRGALRKADKIIIFDPSKHYGN